jgi:hypothetical protein
VSSWRDSASPRAQSDLDDLVKAVLPLAEQTLGKHGELLPYAATVDTEGNEALVSADPSADRELPSSHDVLALLYEAAKNSAEALRAVAFVAAVRVADSDAIRVELEHADGIAMAIVIPYVRDAANETIAIGQSRATAGFARVWI